MKMIKKLIVLLGGIGVIYSITAVNNYSSKHYEHQGHLLAVTELNRIIESNHQDECFDAMMNEWFESFNNLQEEGLSVYEADQQAAELAVAKFTVCE